MKYMRGKMIFQMALSDDDLKSKAAWEFKQALG
jgi:hypothetical protein